MTEPKKQDGTIELDIGQIDLLDLPLPPSSKRSIDEAEAHASHGPPPLPPAPPGGDSAAEPAPPNELASPVEKILVPSLPPPPAPAAVSARKLVEQAPGMSPVTRFIIGMGAASIVCVGTFFALRAFHKTPAPQPASSAAPEPTHAFTMAPVEFTEPADSDSASASAVPSAKAAASATGPASAAATASHTTTSHPSASAPTTHPASTRPTAHPDDVIKVEN